jgi:hypothetical protein
MSTPIITGKQIPDGARVVIQEIMQQSGVERCEVSSVERSPADQARVMTENLEMHGADKQLKLYRDPGQQVIRVWMANHAIISRDELLKLMEAKIMELGPTRVSKHCCGPDSPYWVIDIKPSSIPDAVEAKFISHAIAHPRMLKVLRPPSDPAIHFEISKQ